MKKFISKIGSMFVLTLAAITMAVGLTACDGSWKDKAADIVQKTYDVVLRTDLAIDQISELVAGTPVEDKVKEVADKVDDALDAVLLSLVNVGKWVGLDLDKAVVAASVDFDQSVKALVDANAEIAK